MSKFVILENVADERGESAAKVARTLVRLGCDLYLRFGPSREPRTGVNFFPEHPTGGMEHNIGPGDHPLTKDCFNIWLLILKGTILSIKKI